MKQLLSKRQSTKPQAMIEPMEPRLLLAGVPMLSEGTLLQAGNWNLMVWYYNAAPAVADWNGDGKKDLVVGDGYVDGRIELFQNNGTDANPTFAAAAYPPAWLMVGNTPLITTGDYYMGAAPQVVDWNNDGQKDIVTGEASGKISIFLGSGAGLTAGNYLQVAGYDYAAWGEYSKPDVVDWNNDGKKDLIVGDGKGYVTLLLNTGTDASPVFATETQLLMGPDVQAVSLRVGGMASPVVADWNGDGKKDLLVGAADGMIYYFENTGTDASPAFSKQAMTLSAGAKTLTVGSYARPEVTDWDNDGLLDLLCGNLSGYVYYYHAQPAPTLTVTGPTSTFYEDDSGTTAITFTATLSTIVDQPVSVHWYTSDGTATRANNDYLYAEQRLLIPAGQQTSQFTVLVIGDNDVEADETFDVNFSDPMGLVTTQDRLTATIANDDTPLLSIEDVELPEGDSGTVTFDFPLTLSQASDKAVQVDYKVETISRYTATAGEDYIAVPTGTVTIPAGQTTGKISVTVNCDTRVELDETFFVRFVSATNAELPIVLVSPYLAGATGTIVNDDALGLSINDVSQVEGSAGGTTDYVFTVTLSEPVSTPITFQYATEDGTAKAGVDYTAATGTLTIPARQTTATITIKANADTDNEPDETFNVILSSASDAAVLDDTGVGTIRNDDPVPAAPNIAVAVTWPKKAKATVRNRQKTAIDFGSAKQGSEGPARTFSITNVGDAALQVSQMRMPRGFVLVERPPKTLAPAERTTFSVYVNTAKVGSYSGYITFTTNVTGLSLFYIPVKALVTAPKAAARKAAAPKAAAAKASFVGAFSTSAKRISTNSWLADDKDVL